MITVSVIIATLNEAPDLEKCLASIREQDYEQNKIEILVADGGSIDNTAGIIKKYHGKFIPEKTGSPESAKAIALQQTTGKFILMVDSDNIFPDKNWLKTMVNVLEKEPEAIAVYPWQYAYRKSDSLLNRYLALIGINDPIPWFLGKADRQSYLSDKWILSGKAINKGNYFLVQFNTKNAPTLGANGFLIKKKILMKAKVDPHHFYHIDINMDLIKLGYTKYAVVKNNIIHTGGDNLFTYLKKKNTTWIYFIYGKTKIGAILFTMVTMTY